MCVIATVNSNASDAALSSLGRPPIESHFSHKAFGIRSSEKDARNSFTIRTYKFASVKVL